MRALSQSPSQAALTIIASSSGPQEPAVKRQMPVESSAAVLSCVSLQGLALPLPDWSSMSSAKVSCLRWQAPRLEVA